MGAIFRAFFVKMNPSTIFWSAGKLKMESWYFWKKNDLQKRTCAQLIICSKYNLRIQSNLLSTTTLGTRKKWSLFQGGCYSEGQNLKPQFFLIKKFQWPAWTKCFTFYWYLILNSLFIRYLIWFFTKKINKKLPKWLW